MLHGKRKSSLGRPAIQPPDPRLTAVRELEAGDLLEAERAGRVLDKSVGDNGLVFRRAAVGRNDQIRRSVVRIGELNPVRFRAVATKRRLKLANPQSFPKM